MGKLIHGCVYCANLVEEHPFDQQTWMVCSYDVHGKPTVANLKEAILDIDIRQPNDCIGWQPRSVRTEGYTFDEFIANFYGK